MKTENKIPNKAAKTYSTPFIKYVGGEQHTIKDKYIRKD